MTFAKEMDYFNEEYGQPTQRVAASPEELEKLQEHLPPVLIEYYQTYGFSVFLGGYFQLVNPLTYAPTLRRWLKGTPYENEDEFFAVAMDYMGELKVWGRRQGKKVHS